MKISDKILGGYLRVNRSIDTFKLKVENVFSMASYQGASQDSELKTWVYSKGHKTADSEILRDLQTLRERSRDLYKNNTIGRGAIKTNVANVVGRGLKLQSNIDRKFLKLNDKVADDWEDNVERRFKAWSQTSSADASRRLDFNELTELAFLSYLKSGDVFAMLPLIKRNDSKNSLRVRLIEADKISTPFDQTYNDRIREGVELGKHDEPLRYYIKVNQTTHVSVDAFGKKSGRANVLHLYKQERPGQSRGVPFLSSVISTIKQLGRYKDSELAAAVVSSMFTVFIKSNDPNALDNPNPLGNSKSVEQEESPDYELAPGAIYQLRENEEIDLANPTRPNTSFEGFVNALLKEIGMALQIPLEILTKQFNSSFSASRAAKIEAWKYFNGEREWLSRKFCQPIFVEWLSEEIAHGRIIAPGFFTSEDIQQAYCSCMWVGESMGQIDELKEANAAIARVNAGLSSRQEETTLLNGGDFKRNVRKLKQEKKLLDEAMISKEPKQAELFEPKEGLETLEDEVAA